MADTHEEQLLNELLRTVAREDAQLGAAHLEARVAGAAEEGRGGRESSLVRLKPDTTYFAYAAALALIVLVPLASWLRREPVPAVEVMKPAPAEALVEGRPRPTVQTNALPARRVERPRVQPDVRAERATAPRVTDSPLAESTIEFVPLMPITQQELTGPFQIVRVQMPSASLGSLRSPLQHPSELVEADVLLAEDGTARAIRLSTTGSVYPWRSR